MLQTKLDGYEATRVLGGCSGSEVYRLHAPKGESLFLKIRSHQVDEGMRRELCEEHARLEWLASTAKEKFREQLGAPNTREFGSADDRDFLLLTSVPGVDASDESQAANPEQMVRVLAEGLRRLHTLPVSDCPFNRSLDELLAEAQSRMTAGLVDETDFDECRLGCTAADLWEELLATRPLREDRVFTHGDYCLPNVLLTKAGQFSGLIDWSRCGIADRHLDLSLARRSLIHNWGEQWIPLLWQEYGLATPDPARLEFYQLLDEFF